MHVILITNYLYKKLISIVVLLLYITNNIFEEVLNGVK